MTEQNTTVSVTESEKTREIRMEKLVRSIIIARLTLIVGLGFLR